MGGDALGGRLVRVYKKLNSQNNLYYRVMYGQVEFKGDHRDGWTRSKEFFSPVHFGNAVQQGLYVLCHPDEIKEPELEEVDW